MGELSPIKHYGTWPSLTLWKGRIWLMKAQVNTRSPDKGAHTPGRQGYHRREKAGLGQLSCKEIGVGGVCGFIPWLILGRVNLETTLFLSFRVLWSLCLVRHKSKLKQCRTSRGSGSWLSPTVWGRMGYWEDAQEFLHRVERPAVPCGRGGLHYSTLLWDNSQRCSDCPHWCDIK